MRHVAYLVGTYRSSPSCHRWRCITPRGLSGLICCEERGGRLGNGDGRGRGRAGENELIITPGMGDCGRNDF